MIDNRIDSERQFLSCQLLHHNILTQCIGQVLSDSARLIHSTPSFTHLWPELLQQSIDDSDLLHDTGSACTTFRRSIFDTYFVIKTIEHIISEPAVHFLELLLAELVHWLPFLFGQSNDASAM